MMKVRGLRMNGRHRRKILTDRPSIPVAFFIPILLKMRITSVLLIGGTLERVEERVKERDWRHQSG